MVVKHGMMASAMAGLVLLAVPAQAQFFLKPPSTRGDAVNGTEPGILGVPALPGATPKELRAALVWNVRAALNVAALQCSFEPTLLTLSNYNFMLHDHVGELKESYDTLDGYFTRVNRKNKALGSRALDDYNTRLYSGFSTVSAQYTFCQTAGLIGRQVMFTPRGKLGDVAAQRMRELRNSLSWAGEQQFRRYSFQVNMPMPPFGNPRCWSKRDEYEARRCGPWNGVVNRRRG